MIRPGAVIAKRLGREVPDEDGAGMAHLGSSASASATASSRCSGAMRFASAHSFVEIACFDQRPASGERGCDDVTTRHVRQLALDALRDRCDERPSGDSRMACASSSCSACEKRSIAIQSGLFVPSATTRISDGPATMSIPTTPNTRRFAAATYAFPGPTILSTAGTVSSHTQGRRSPARLRS